jgi:hypothetical protein
MLRGEGVCNVKTITSRVHSAQSHHKLCATPGWNFVVSETPSLPAGRKLCHIRVAQALHRYGKK